jgi:hypothetical protein
VAHGHTQGRGHEPGDRDSGWNRVHCMTNGHTSPCGFKTHAGGIREVIMAGSSHI